MNRHRRIREAGLERIYEMIDMAIEMGGEYFIFHPGRLAYYSMSTKQVFFMEQRYPEKISEIFTDSLKKILAHAAGRIKICVENTHSISSPYLAALGRLATEDSLFLVWDVGHTEQLTGARRGQLIKFFQDNVRYVKLAHLHDIKDEADHKSLGTGRLDVAAYLEIFNAMSIDIILEIFPEAELLNSLNYLKGIELTDKIK
jgi:sugar phosphate isomerase/epimerase